MVTRSPDTMQLSFEFSAPRSEQAKENLINTYQKLVNLDPDYVSVTYGAGGSTKDGTVEAVMALAEQGAEVAPHLSFGRDSEETIATLLHTYKNAGINRLVALRGDVPSGIAGSSHLAHASDLVAFIRRETQQHFHIAVAAYPEVHPESTSVKSDLDHFKLKMDAGADSAISQYFYNADAYFRFLDNCAAMGISTSVVPGIMPITNLTGLIRFSNNCGADIPRWLIKHLEQYASDVQALRAFGEEIVTSLCERLLEGGAPGLHFYTLNHSRASTRICRNLGL
ncbi:MAG: methylenetetrahydrofolate reductase [NAD(P)H] [Gammaproteobacteria bacterium]|nr:methylenetetrahydrofolate reductase [NAD(P)H] [Gammaproteobacteria bacterium]